MSLSLSPATAAAQYSSSESCTCVLKVIMVLGRGGMGIVCLAHDEELERVGIVRATS